MSKRDLFAPFRAAYKAEAEKNNGPKYWRSVAHKTSDPLVVADLDVEFPSGTAPLPEMQRRDVLKLAGASLALAGLSTACIRRPEEEILPYTHQPAKKGRGGWSRGTDGRALLQTQRAFVEASPPPASGFPLRYLNYVGTGCTNALPRSCRQQACSPNRNGPEGNRCGDQESMRPPLRNETTPAALQHRTPLTRRAISNTDNLASNPKLATPRSPTLPDRLLKAYSRPFRHCRAWGQALIVNMEREEVAKRFRSSKGTWLGKRVVGSAAT